MDKLAISAAAKKLISLHNKGDSWQFMNYLRRLAFGGPAKRAIPTHAPLQLNKFLANRASAVENRLLDRSEKLPFFSQLYMALAGKELSSRIMDPTRRGNISYMKRLRQHLNRRGFKPLPGNRMQWQLPQNMKNRFLQNAQQQFSQLKKSRALTAAQGALKDSTIGRYSPYLAQNPILRHGKLFQPQKYSQYPPSRLQQIIRDEGINSNFH